MIMSLRDGDFPSKQSPLVTGDCFATCARNDMERARLASSSKILCSSGLQESQSQTQEELDELLPSVLRPQGEAFREEFHPSSKSHIGG